MALYVSCSTTINAAAQDSIDLRLQKATSGEVIYITAQEYGHIYLANLRFDPPVILDFAEQGVVQSMTIVNTSGLVFENLHINAGHSAKPEREKAVFIVGGGNLVFRNAKFQWSDDQNPLNDGALMVLDGTIDVTIANSNFAHGLNGLAIRSSSNINVFDSIFTEITHDGIIISGSNSVSIRGNLCTNFRSSIDPESHPDCVQLQSGKRRKGNENIEITHNIILQGEGDKYQPIFIKSNHASATHKRIKIEHNKMRQSTAIGIHVADTIDLIIRDNLVLPSQQSKDNPRIVVRDSVRNALIEKNTAARIRAPAGSIVRDNFTTE